MALSIVTGANRGIGLALVRALLQRGDHVLAACRKSSLECNNPGGPDLDDSICVALGGNSADAATACGELDQPCCEGARGTGA